MHMEMIAAASNLGGPKWNGRAMPNQPEAETDEKSSRCIGQAISVPMMIASRTAVWLKKPRVNRLIATMIKMTTAARMMCEMWP